jgi:ferrous iron transport protein B
MVSILTRKSEKNIVNPSNVTEVKKIAILGLPNTGKSQVFNNLTGKYTLVANYPLTTIEMKKTKCLINGQAYEVIDTPGLHCLYIHSEEELVVRDMLFSEKPDIIIQCIDANQLKQSLTLTSDLMELGIPMVISLNAVDETAKKGIWIDSDGLSQILGVPVIESIAVNGLGTKDLKAAIGKARKGKLSVNYGEIIENNISAIASELPEDERFKRKCAVLLLLDDPFIADHLTKQYGSEKIAQLTENVNRIKKEFRANIGQAINNKRSRWVEKLTEKTTRKQKIALGQFSAAFGRLSRHPVFGVPILLFFLLTTFLLVVHVAGFLDAILSATILDPTIEFIDGLFKTEDGSIKSQFWYDFLVGHYGILTLGLFNAIVTILPILSVFFLMFGFLEDIGYMPNLCVLVKRVFEKIGLTGKAIMPLVLALGCKTMATLVTKSLRSRKEKFITIYLIAFAIPCAAQLAIDMGIIGRLGSLRIFGFLIAYGTLATVEIGVGFLLNKTIKDDEKSEFIQELPAIRLPNPKAIIVKTYYRLYWFLKEALPIFIIAAAALFFIDRIGLLDLTKTALSPIVVGWLGLPLDIVDAMILSLARHEAAAGLLLNMVDEGSLNFIQCIVAVTITTMFVPCFANIVAMCKEMGVKTGISITMAINVSSFVLAGILHWILVFTIGKWFL